MLGAQCAMPPELFGNRHRFTGVAMTREFSAVVAGAVAPLLAVMSDAWWPPAVYVFVLVAITFTTMTFCPETPRS
jgi:MFS transporter, MHS family, metabolite:H+ symporter